jgi:hypothetical protein
MLDTRCDVRVRQLLRTALARALVAVQASIVDLILFLVDR